MLVRSYAHQEWTMLKWIMLFALAGVLTVVFARGLAGANDRRPPTDERARLLREIADWPAAMRVVEDQRPVVEEDITLRVWQALDTQYHEEFSRAVALWEAIQMPCETEVWKYVALGQCHLANNEVKDAQAALAKAEKLEPKNAVVHYLLGVLRLRQACMAYQWNDAIGLRTTVVVAHASQDVVPNTESMYRLAAMMELEDAITLAPRINLNLAIIPDDRPTASVMPPTVHDLLLAAVATNFVPNSHHMLGDLHLYRGALKQAEHHMDEAVAGGLSVVSGYDKLAREYENAGRHADAMRA